MMRMGGTAAGQRFADLAQQAARAATTEAAAG
jgi:hypothetical protein